MKRSLLLLAVLSGCNSSKQLAPDSAGAPPDAVSLDAALDAVLADAEPDAQLPPDPMTSLQEMPGLCTPDEWCWVFPTPTGNRYFGIFSSSADNIWLYGARGTILQWDGRTWTSHHPPALPTEDFVRWPWSMHGRASNDMWLILQSAVEHWNGVTWTIVETGNTHTANYYHNVWEAPNGDVWTTGQFGVRRSVGGGPFALVYPAPSGAGTVWGIDADDVFIAIGGSIIHWDGATFTTVHNTQGAIYGFYQGAKNDVWASGPNANLAHWDGTTFTRITPPVAASDWMHEAGYRAANDVWWFTGGKFVHWDGSTFTAPPVDLASYGEFCCLGVSAAQIIGDRWWMVGDAGGVFTKVGSNAMQPVISPMFLGSSMWGTADNDMYVGDGSEVRHWDGHAWTRLATPVGGVIGLKGTGFGGTNELFSLGWVLDFATYEYVFTAYHFDGISWTGTVMSRMPAAAVTPRPDQWQINSIYPLRSGEALAVGTRGHALHYKNGVWTPFDSGTIADLSSIWGPDPDHLWITGAAGTLLHWTSTAPDTMTPDTTLPQTADNLGPITGTGGTVWIANAQSSYTTLVRRHTATGWDQIDANVQPLQIAAIAENNVLATTFDNGHISRWNGTEFVIEDYGYETALYYMFTPPGGHTWITNGRGIMQHP